MSVDPRLGAPTLGSPERALVARVETRPVRRCSACRRCWPFDWEYCPHCNVWLPGSEAGERHVLLVPIDADHGAGDASSLLPEASDRLVFACEIRCPTEFPSPEDCREGWEMLTAFTATMAAFGGVVRVVPNTGLVRARQDVSRLSCYQADRRNPGLSAPRAAGPGGNPRRVSAGLSALSPHFRWALQAAGDKATLDCLVEAERERLRTLLSDRSGDQEVPLSELTQYVTEEGNPGNEKAVLEARVVVPVAFLRRGLHFIDTPGVGSTRRENTETTYAFLPEADAVIFVTSVEAPLSEAEQRFLWEIRQYAPKLFVVVNKLDVLASGERERVLSYIATGIAQALAVNEIRVLPLSARQGLSAKLSHDRAGIRASGLEAFEDTLAEFLAAEKERTFLVTIVDRARQLLSGDSTESEGVRARMASMRARLLAGRTLAGAGWLLTTGGVDPDLLERAAAVTRARPRREEGVRTRTCPVCAAHAETLFTVLARWQHMLATDEAARRAFAAGRGFCPLHTWQFQQVASPQGISEGYALLVDAVAAELRHALAQVPEGAAVRVGALLPTTETCPACRVLREMEDEQLREVLRQVSAVDAGPGDAPSLALCLPHLRSALARAPSAETTRFLLREQLRRLEELSEDLRSYALKRDALRRGLLNADEDSAWRRALVVLAGERAVRGLWSG